VFLDFLRRRNPALLDCAAGLVADGAIEPDTYVIDLDAVEQNADRLLRAAADAGIFLYFMSKQVGRNPEVARRVLARRVSAGPRGRFAGMVAVDWREALTLQAAGLPVRHVGHLVQIPDRSIDSILDMEPEAITVYSLEKASSIARAARERGRVQGLLLRVSDAGDLTYPGQEGGFSPDAAVEAATAIGELEGARFAGLTSFPCFLYDPDRGAATATRNARTLSRTAALIRNRLGVDCPQVNMPSCTSIGTLPAIAALGGTHGEPGHSLTGTNPDNPESADPLIPALVYATEVSHCFEYRSLCFGGGHYRRSHVTTALVGAPGAYTEAAVLQPECEAIDYHFSLAGTFPVGTPVLMAFRTQIFVTRSRVALVEGLSAGKPALVGTWDSQGRPL
jgi:predicted amino acid racemase